MQSGERRLFVSLKDLPGISLETGGFGHDPADSSTDPAGICCQILT